MSSAIVCLTKGLVFCTEFKADCFVLKNKVYKWQGPALGARS